MCHVVGAPLWYLILYAQVGFWQQYACLTLVLLVIPLIIGLAWSYVIQREFIEKHSGRLGLYAVHHVNTAWDWKFSRIRAGEWIMVTLKDGTEHAGYIGSDSFIASGEKDRDIYIEQVYDLDEKNLWSHPGRRKSLLIPYSEVKSIVFWPDNMEAIPNVKDTDG